MRRTTNQSKGENAMRHLDRSTSHHGRRWLRHGGLLIAMVAMLLTATGGGTAWAATLFTDNFEDGNAAGWITTGGTWIVTQESSKVLHQSSLAANALARAGQPGWRDYTVTADVKPTSFNGFPGFVGVVARAQSTTTYYALVLRPNNTAELTRTVGGTASTLAVMRVAVSAGTTYTLALRTAGQSLTGWVNGVAVTASDGFIFAGQAGLVTTWTTASFDNVIVNT